MLKDLFKKKPAAEVIDAHEEVDVVLRLMFEIAISDGNLDEAELKIIKERANIVSGKDTKVSTIIKKIIDDAQESVSFYPFVKKINETHNNKEKKDLLKILALSLIIFNSVSSRFPSLIAISNISLNTTSDPS